MCEISLIMESLMLVDLQIFGRVIFPWGILGKGAKLLSQDLEVLLQAPSAEILLFPIVDGTESVSKYRAIRRQLIMNSMTPPSGLSFNQATGMDDLGLCKALLLTRC